MATRRVHLPPDAANYASTDASRIGRLERQGPAAATVIDPTSEIFTFPGELYADTSSPFHHKTGAGIAKALVAVRVQDAATNLVLNFRRAGALLTPIGSGAIGGDTGWWLPMVAELPAGETSGWVHFSGERLGPDSGALTIELVSFGADARALEVRVDFA